MMILKYMQKALSEAKKAYLKGEIPVGCIITENDRIIASAHNTVIENSCCTCHAEINAIREATNALGVKELAQCNMYVTLEPCPMCAGAIVNAKIKRLYIGAPEPKSGCFGSVTDFNRLPFNHKPEVYHGICEDESKKMLRNFFDKKR